MNTLKAEEYTFGMISTNLHYIADSQCDMVPENICAAIAGCVPNPAKIVCEILEQSVLYMWHAIHQAMNIALRCMEDNFESLG